MSTRTPPLITALLLHALRLASFASLVALCLSIALLPTTPWLESTWSAAQLPPPLRPHRPLWLGVLNAAVLGPLQGLASRTGVDALVFSLRPSDVRARAVRVVGSSDFDDEEGEFREGLERLCASLESESALTPMGAVLTAATLDIWVQNRLKIARHVKAMAGRGEELPRVTRPVFVIGMPRSGTTFLHNLLTIDTKHFRAPRLWEVTDPVPPLGLEGRDWERAWRKFVSWAGVEGFKTFARNVHAVHPISHDNAEECMPILCVGMMSLQFNTVSNVSRYNDWFLSRDQSTAFKWHKRVLQVLQSGVTSEGGQRQSWLLKAPIHLNHIDVILKTYPDAVILSPHRDPADMLSSLSSLHARFYGIVSDEIRPREIGAYQKKQWELVLGRYLAARRAFSPEQRARVLDLSFEDLSSDPIGVVRRVYAHLGLALSHETETRMRDWLAHDVLLGKKGAAGKHEYDASWFGLDKDVVSSVKVFREYSDAFVASPLGSRRGAGES